MFAQNKHTGKVYGWVGGHITDKYPSDILSVLDEKFVMGIKRHDKAEQAFGVFTLLCKKYNPGVYNTFLVRLSKNKHSHGLKCAYIDETKKKIRKPVLVKYEFSYETV